MSKKEKVQKTWFQTLSSQKSTNGLVGVLEYADAASYLLHLDWHSNIGILCFSSEMWLTVIKLTKYVISIIFIMLTRYAISKTCILYILSYYLLFLVTNNEFDFLVFNATFSNISAISWRPVIVVGEAGVPGENHPGQTNGKLYHLRLRVECTLFCD